MMRHIYRNPTVISVVLLLCLAALWYFHVLDAYRDDPLKAFTVLGTLVAAVWTLYLFLLRGSFETSLSIDISVDTQARGGQFVVFLEITLQNVGGRRITAPPALSEKQIEDYEDSVKYPCDLQLRAIDSSFSGPQFVGWWSRRGLLINIQNIPQHVSALYEYTRSDHAVDFFMEPGEKYVLGHIFVLPPGNYVAKVVFVGERATAAEYWSRIICFGVPTAVKRR